MSLATVLIPNYNNAPFLNEALDSVFNQSFTDFQVLVIDDGSTDNSLQVLAQIKDPRLNIIVKKNNSGIVDTLNEGLNRIATKYIIRMDGDDLSMPKRFETLINYMEKHPAIGVCSSALQLFGKQNSIWTVQERNDQIKAGMIHGSTIPHAPSIIRTEILTKNNIKYSNRNSHMEDYDLFFRLKNFTNFANLPQALYQYRIAENNVTISNSDTREIRMKKMYGDVLTELKLPCNEANINLHYDFFQKNKPTASPNQYCDFALQLLQANNSLHIYPQQAFKKVIFKYWNILFCRFIDLDKKYNKEFKKLPFQLTWRSKYYYFRR